MKTKTTRSFFMACLLCVIITTGFSQVCNSSGNLMIFTNYDGGNLTINVDQNIPNLKIGICSYEGCNIVLTGAFVNNVTAVRYAGFNSNNNHCGSAIATSINGTPGTAVTSTVFAPPAPLTNSNGYGSIICGYSCSNSTSQGGCNTPDQVEAYFLNYFPGSALYAHKIQYNCWSGTQNLSAGGSCCPVPSVYPGTIAASQATVCAGSVPGSLNSTAAATVATGTILYQWQSSASAGSGFSDITSATAATYAPPALSNTTYYRRGAGTATNSMVYSNTVSIAIPASPVITIAGPSSICTGASATLTASGGSGYTWNIAGNTGPSIIVTPTQSSVYTTTCFPPSGSGCTTTATKTITVLPVPVVTASASAQTLCAGQSATLDASGAIGYNWMPGNLTGGNVVVTPMATESYTVTGTGANGCGNIAVVNIIVNSLPALQVNASNTTACSGATVNLSANGAVNYTWMPGSQVSAAITFTAGATATYTLYGEYNGCTNTAIQVINVIPSPTVTAAATKTMLCKGEPTTLTASGGVSYAWSNSTATGATLTVSPSADVIYTVTGTAANNCTGLAMVQMSVSNCIGISEIGKDNSGLQIFPNPSNGEFTIKAAGAMDLDIVNSAGQTLRIVKLSDHNGYKVSVSGLAKGIYFVVSKNNTGNIKQKIVIGE